MVKPGDLIRLPRWCFQERDAEGVGVFLGVREETENVVLYNILVEGLIRTYSFTRVASQPIDTWTVLSRVEDAHG